MAQLIQRPTRIQAAGNKLKWIGEMVRPERIGASHRTSLFLTLPSEAPPPSLDDLSMSGRSNRPTQAEQSGYLISATLPIA